MTKKRVVDGCFCFLVAMNVCLFYVGNSVDGCFCFLVAMSMCLFDVGNSVEGVCGVLCVSNV